ncbi:histidine kinase [Halobacteriales archaeon QH_10_67_22]|nr:MAG: histidine kinase [Halobacteriales archaeon QH_10_67_22]
MLGGSLSFAGNVLLFTVAAVGCLATIPRARTIEDDDTRRGLVGLLVCTAAWAAFELLFFVGPQSVVYGAYVVSLVVGLAAVGAWLYFCSAYTGRRFHLATGYRRLAAATYLSIVAVKVTNPVHGLYFNTRLVQEPFVHVTVRHGVFHWVVTGLSYALVAVGFFMLYELFLEADYNTRPLGIVVAITALPAVLDIIGYTTDLLLDINHEPLGVAAFALAVLYVFEERFLSVQVTGDVDDPLVFLDGEGRIRDYNDRARRLFPELVGSVGQRLAAMLPDAAAAADSDDGVFERSVDGTTRYFFVENTSFSLERTAIGEVLVFADVTGTERQRRELQRQNAQLEGLATAIRHELRNTLQIVRSRVVIAGDAVEDGDTALARESFETATETADRMERIVDDLSTLAQYGQTLEDTEDVSFRDAVEEAWDRYDGDDLSLRIEGRGSLKADRGRLRELLGMAFEFASHNDASTVTVTLREGGFAITDDGTPHGDTDPETFFEYGGAVPHAETGVTLPNIQTLARAHGWATTVDTSYEGGLRIVVSEVETELVEPARV